jgi:hypothetical protein
MNVTSMESVGVNLNDGRLEIVNTFLTRMALT